MTWGGLRGGISIALALSIQGEYHNFIVSVTYAVVLFSIMVQGLTISPLIKAKMESDSYNYKNEKEQLLNDNLSRER